MHFLIGLCVVIGLVGFAFGEGAARGFAQGLFVLAGLAVGLLIWDYYREIPVKQPDRYKVLQLETFPRKTNPNAGVTFK